MAETQELSHSTPLHLETQPSAVSTPIPQVSASNSSPFSNKLFMILAVVIQVSIILGAAYYLMSKQNSTKVYTTTPVMSKGK